MNFFEKIIVTILVAVAFTTVNAFANLSNAGCRLNSVYQANGSDLTFSATSRLMWQGDEKQFLPACMTASREGSLGDGADKPYYIGELISSDVTFVSGGIRLTGQLKMRQGLSVSLSPRCHIKSNYFAGENGLIFQAEGNLDFEYAPDGNLVACVEQAMVGIGPMLDAAIFRNLVFKGSEISFSVESYDFNGRIDTMPSGEL